MQAVYDLLGVRLEKPHRRDHPFNAERRRINYLLHVAGGNLRAAEALLATTDPASIDSAVIDLQQRWFAGEQIASPAPALTATSPMTPSKITKAARPTLDATGVAWEPRTDAGDYARTLTRKTLMTQQKAELRGFGSAPIVAVGGVKGGVGKTTTAAALGRALAATGKRVVLVDLDLDGPNLHLEFGLAPRVAVTDDLTRLVAEEVAPNLRVFSRGQIDAAGLPHRWTQAAATDWVRFLGQTLYVADADVIIFDLPAGQGPVVNEVLVSHSQAQADVLVAVTTSDPFALADTRSGLVQHMHEQRQQILVENLGRVIGITADGATVEVRPHGSEQEVRNLLTGTVQGVYGGSLPYATSTTALAASPEMQNLAALVAQAGRIV